MTEFAGALVIGSIREQCVEAEADQVRLADILIRVVVSVLYFVLRFVAVSPHQSVQNFPVGIHSTKFKIDYSSNIIKTALILKPTATEVEGSWEL